MGVVTSLRKMTRNFRRRIYPVDEEKRRARPKKPMSFSYWAMFRRRGLRLPLAFFFECHLYDLQHKTDTHEALYLTKYNYKPEHFEHGTWYMSSWTSEILNSFESVRQHLGERFHEYTFVDIGCGKGKVVLAWKEELKKYNIDAEVVGIEYYRPLLDIAINNYRKLFAEDGRLYEADASTFTYENIGSKLIVYLNNPFDDVLLRKIVRRLSGIEVVIIYNNPLHYLAITECGYKVIYEKSGWHPYKWTMILINAA